MKEIIGGTICMILMSVAFVGWMFLGRVLEDQIRCDNGATQYCMEE